MNLRADGRALRIGHKGAAAHAPENTIASLRRAVELGVDLIEFDVLDLEDGTLVLAHSDDLHEVSHGAAAGSVRRLTLPELRAAAPDLPTLDEALEFFASEAAGTGVHVDLKGSGYEQGVVEALRRHSLLGRSFVSTFHVPSLRKLAELEPRLTRGLTYPYDRRGVTSRAWLTPAILATLAAIKRTLPLRIAGLLERAGASVAVLHYTVVSRATVARCHRLGVPVVTWTVDEPVDLRRVLADGVDAVVTNNPLIFDLH